MNMPINIKTLLSDIVVDGPGLEFPEGEILTITGKMFRRLADAV